jgi:hypothetical protein
MSEIHQSHDTENDGEAERQKCIFATEAKRVKRLLKKIVHGG